MTRLTNTFARAKAQKRPALITFTMAGDPDMARSEALLMELPGAGVDIVELGMPFSDPTADGPTIQQAGFRALQSGTTLKAVLALAGRFRARHPHTPLVLMGYYNPVLRYGPEAFARDAAHAGVDGVIIVDLPPEEEEELTGPLNSHRLAFIRLIAPTTGDARLERLLQTASGFVYTIAVKGITGGASADAGELQARVRQIQQLTSLPVVAGFGIKSREDIAALGDAVDGAVVGSALIEYFNRKKYDIKETLSFVRALTG